MQPVVIHYHRLATKFQTFHSLGHMFVLFWFKPNHLWYSCMVSVSRFSRSSALIATFFFLSFFRSLFLFLVIASSPSSHIMFSLPLNIFFLDYPSFCTLWHNKSPGCFKKFVQQYASIKQHPRIISPFMLGFML